MLEVKQLTLCKLEAIVRLSGLGARRKLPYKATLTQVVQYEGLKYKVRAYPDPQKAQLQLEFLKKSECLFAPCRGQVERFLVFEFLDGRIVDANEAPSRLGLFLAKLTALKVEPLNALFQNQFDGWCHDIECAGIFRPQTIDLICSYYERVARQGIRWNVEHYDAMPRNFVLLDDGRFLSIDEKHLRVGPRGVSFVKLTWDLPPSISAKIKTCYVKETHTAELNESWYLEFLEFYYLVYSLAFNGSDRSLLTNLSVPQFHDRRRKLLRIIGAPSHTFSREQLPWLTAHAAIQPSRKILRVLRQLIRRCNPRSKAVQIEQIDKGVLLLNQNWKCDATRVPAGHKGYQLPPT